jgi:cellulose synthase (UDP-forming)
MKTRFDKLIKWTLVTEIIYLVWLITAIEGIWGWIYFLLELGCFLLIILLMISYKSRQYIISGGPYSLRNMVDVFIIINGEPIKTIEKTIRAARLIAYPNIRIYLISNKEDEEIKRLAKKYQSDYLINPKKRTKTYRADLLNYALVRSYGNYVLVLNGDQIIKPTIIDDLLGHFKDKKVAYIITRQLDNIFGNNFNFGDDVEIYRRSALLTIGGFSEWNVLEDLSTAYIFDTYEFKGVYVNQQYTIGETLNLKNVYEQQKNRALDSLRLMVWRLPFLNNKLAFNQKLHYFETGYIYFVSGFILPAIFLINFYSLFFNKAFISTGGIFLILKMVSFGFTLEFLNKIDKGLDSFKKWCMWFPIYFGALIRAVLYKKPFYKKIKNTSQKRQLSLFLPQTLTIIIGIIILWYHFQNFHITQFLLVNLFWFGAMIFWLRPFFLDNSKNN